MGVRTCKTKEKRKKERKKERPPPPPHTHTHHTHTTPQNKTKKKEKKRKKKKKSGCLTGTAGKKRNTLHGTPFNFCRDLLHKKRKKKRGKKKKTTLFFRGGGGGGGQLAASRWPDGGNLLWTSCMLMPSGACVQFSWPGRTRLGSRVLRVLAQCF